MMLSQRRRPLPDEAEGQAKQKINGYCVCTVSYLIIDRVFRHQANVSLLP